MPGLLSYRSQLAILAWCGKLTSVSRVTRLRFIRPQLATSVDQPPEGENWIHEIKHDGYRCQVLLEGGRARVLTRTGLDWSEHYPAIVHAAVNLDCQSAIIDGEAIIQDENGVSDFEALALCSVAVSARHHALRLRLNASQRS